LEIFKLKTAWLLLPLTLLLGIPLKNIKKGLEGLKTIPGRFEKISGKNFNIIIDYAHTPRCS